MLLPNEILLDVLAFSDFGTLVSAKFVDATFLDVVTKFAAELAHRRRFQVLFNTSYITYVDVTIGTRRKSVRYEPGDQSSLAAACRELAGVIGSHVVAKLICFDNTWNTTAVGTIFEAAPALKYAEDVDLYSEPGLTTVNDSEAFMRNFLLKGTRLKLTIRTRNVSELVLDERYHTVDVDNTTRRYASVKSGIVVEVKGRWIAIKRTGTVLADEARSD